MLQVDLERNMFTQPQGFWWNPDKSYGCYLGPRATVMDTELQTIALALSTEDSANTTILSDSHSAVSTTLALSQGAPPRSGIEKEIKNGLHRRHDAHWDTSISWVRSHIGIEGNEKADRLASFHSARGRLCRPATRLSTPNGLRAISKKARSEARSLPSFGSNTSWNRQASENTCKPVGTSAIHSLSKLCGRSTIVNWL